MNTHSKHVLMHVHVFCSDSGDYELAFLSQLHTLDLMWHDCEKLYYIAIMADIQFHVSPN